MGYHRIVLGYNEEILWVMKQATAIGSYGAIMREDVGPAITSCARRCVARSVIYHELQSIKAGQELAVKHRRHKVEINSAKKFAFQIINKERKPN
ncbi:hypothetical protein GIB67_028460 [Kingdonia uniflora]|uniref:Uncharacterized protein n=1 Tax=Kingdonia uniflora TaxID=39325 RepID=A0A7J7P1Q5_9MAGN|nr:hypothetical protein GIB67_028460 [Kingdonia uniflora]